MDLNQRKLDKSEWESIEIPVIVAEKEILKLMIDGYHDVNIKYNNNQSLFTYLKIEYNSAIEDYLYNKYLSIAIDEIKKTHLDYLKKCFPENDKFNIFKTTVSNNPIIKKADSIRIDKNTIEKVSNSSSNVFEYLLIQHIDSILKNKKNNKKNWTIHYFTLYKLNYIYVLHINTHIKKIVNNLLSIFEDELNMTDFIKNSVEFIEKNSILLKNADIQLYDHQKMLYTICQPFQNASNKKVDPTQIQNIGKSSQQLGKKQVDKPVDKQADKQSDKQSDKQAEKHADKQVVKQMNDCEVEDWELDDCEVEDWENKNWDADQIADQIAVQLADPLANTVDLPTEQTKIKSESSLEGSICKVAPIFIPKLILYIAPTGTGKTLSPIGLSEKYKIIFICAARHVGLALAKSAISVGKKIAFAFGCSCAADIRLHYFAAKEYTKDWRTGGIRKVDNSVGDKVEIMICDVKSYIPAMNYMQAFNSVSNLLMYWDEPTITMDLENHDLHKTIQENWQKNEIPNVILSSATLPKLHELTETIADFTRKFPNAEIHNIVSHDCKKSIPIINKSGYVILPHYLTEDYTEILQIVAHCESNVSLLRYFDLKETINFIQLVEENNYIPSNCKINRNFASLDDVNMMNIKLHYLKVLKNVIAGTWGAVHTTSKMNKTKYYLSNDTIDTKGNTISNRGAREACLSKVASIGPGVSYGGGGASNSSGKPLVKMSSVSSVPTVPAESSDSAIYITTKDAYTLTDGPTIFLAMDIEKIAQFCIQQANIPSKVMIDIIEKIEFNNKINDKISILEHNLDDIYEKGKNKSSSGDDSKEAKKAGGGTKSKEHDSDKPKESEKGAPQIIQELETLRSMIKSAELNDTFVPNKSAHLKKWAENMCAVNAFTSNINEETVVKIMMLTDVIDSWKIMLLMGIGVFTNHKSITYTEIMKKLADEQKLYMIIASSDYIYGMNYQFCHGYLSKDLTLTQEKIIQALGRVGRNNIQQKYSVRFRDDSQIRKLFYEEHDKIEVINMNRLFSTF
jgi:hypothetical protein